ncbi:hypothetical protein DTL21_10965 [Bremerella cremea]|uniref:Uncharacterized protein n=1 Tax=Blastopirellula marina TaxID=124 RepID=A0A2S8FT28_9BACT|nr:MULTISPECIES: hypothetical protein [Pirellulaceae]PQO35338.1 hypothetical protein C5Y83_10960 [Blastopirellula marina]RCS48288.1 hypothetical protein DTL21_10965 [Bremerella cremea]
MKQIDTKFAVAFIQTFCGSVATLLMLFAFIYFYNPLRSSLVAIDDIVGRADSEAESLQLLLKKAASAGSKFEATLPQIKATINSSKSAVAEVSTTLKVWREKIPVVKTFANDVADICGTVEKELPLTVPVVEIPMKKVEFQIPEVIPQTQKVEIPFPTVSKTEYGSQKMTYPRHATVKMKDFSKGLGSWHGHSFGSIGFSYPSGIDIKKNVVHVKYPKSIKIGTSKKVVEVPKSPLLEMHGVSFSIPDCPPEFKTRRLMEKEKEVLQTLKIELSGLNDELVQTEVGMASIEGLLNVEAKNSLELAHGGCEEVEKELGELLDDVLPSVLDDITDQRKKLEGARNVFSAISGLVTIAFFVLILIPGGITASGVVKLISARH